MVYFEIVISPKMQNFQNMKFKPVENMKVTLII